MDCVTDNVEKRVATGWRAKLALQLQEIDGCTRLTRRQHNGPLYVQRPFYPEDNGTCHLYILHPPGGVVGGDQLEIQVQAAHQAKVLITTPAAGKCYRSAGAYARVANYLEVQQGAWLEWFPQETILYNGSKTELNTRVQLADDSAQFVGWEVICLGCPAAEAYFRQGSCRQAFEIWKNEQPVWIDRALYGASGTHAENTNGQSLLQFLQAPWGLGGNTVVGTMVCTTTEAGLAAWLREQLAAFSATSTRLVVTALAGVLVVRYLGNDAFQARALFSQCWQLLRPQLSGREMVLPRIWNT